MLQRLPLLTCLLIASFCLSQTTSTAQERLLIEGSDTSVVIPYIRAKILFASIADLSERIRLDSMRIYGLQQSNKDLKEALRLSGEIIANNEKAVENYKEIIANNKKKCRNRIFYFTGAGVVAGFVVGVLVR